MTMSTALPSEKFPAGAKRSRLTAGRVGAVVLLLIALPCYLTLPWTLTRYDDQQLTQDVQLQAPGPSAVMGTDLFGRSLLIRSMVGGAISLGIGISAAAIAVVIGVTYGATAGYIGGRIDALMMRSVDVLYGLPYILLVVLLAFALRPTIANAVAGLGNLLPSPTVGGALVDQSKAIGNVVTLLIAIGAVNWLTMARVIRGQVLSLRAQPFVEAGKAYGVGHWRMLRVHLLPNLIGPIVVYATLAVPAAVLQESFLSFLGIGVQAPLPSWGNLASEGVKELPKLASGGRDLAWWLLFFPCLLLALTLMSLNFLGDALRQRFDPRDGR